MESHRFATTTYQLCVKNAVPRCATWPAQWFSIAIFLLIQAVEGNTLFDFRSHRTGVSSTAVLEPLWGCEISALPPGAVHVVISSYNADPEQLIPWIWHLGLTNAEVYVYYRTEDPSIPKLYNNAIRLPCNMSLIVRSLLPNKGREAAVFLHHMVYHYENLPMAMVLAHDHGPASRHSLCGPFYRRLRGYYRGLLERLERLEAREGEAEEGQEEEAGWSLGRRKRSKLGVFERFAEMVVTLSSGCIESWARGCCSAFICSSYAPACPFQNANCTHAEPSKRRPDGVRHVYLHSNGMYDARYENQVVAMDGTQRPVALLRYISAAHRSTEMWNISHEYPPDITRINKERTLAILHGLLARYGFTHRRRSKFKSCCASLILRKEHIRRWPIELYKDLLAYSMDPLMDYEATKAVSGPGWALWLDREYSPQDMLHYVRVDNLLKHIQGCPAQFSSQMSQLLGSVPRRSARGNFLRSGAVGRQG